MPRRTCSASGCWSPSTWTRSARSPETAACRWTRSADMPTRRDLLAAGMALPVYQAADFGVRPGETVNTANIQRAIDKAAADGGGVVSFGPGAYLTGTISLRTNVTLYLEAGAVIQGSGKREDYTQPCLIFAEA